MSELLFRKGVPPVEEGLAPPRHSVEVVDGMRIETDVAITLEDGARMYADVYVPAEVEVAPVILAWSPYGKHHRGPANYGFIADESNRRGGGVDPRWLSPYAGFEAPDPLPWTRAGYAVVTVDPRGTWWSEGEYASTWGEREARDCAQVIEWAGTQSWSTGKVGMSGVSYLAISQWWVASLNPSHLAAINPCEGLTDPYREFAFHGGIPDTGFPSFWQRNRLKYSTSKVEAMADMMELHPFDDHYWASKRPDLEQVTVPAYVIASWSDQGLHTRGTLAAFERIRSKDKYLEVHGRKKWEYFHQPSTFARQRAFFDTYLKGSQGTEVEAWPRVRLELRTGFYEGVEHTGNAWPLPDRTLRTLHLDAATKSLTETAPAGPATIVYDAGRTKPSVIFEHVFKQRTDMVGPASLRLWITAQEAEDADLFVGLKKIGVDGTPVTFPFANCLEKGPVALGWLRASHRETDVDRSTPDRPHHVHHEELPLVPGEPTLVDVELWPSGTRFGEGERLQLVVRGSDLYKIGVFSRHEQTRNHGSYVISTGGEHDSCLVFGMLDGNRA